MIILMNSAMMPHEGIYIMKKITDQEFFNKIKETPIEQIQSLIGWPENLRLIYNKTNVQIPISREDTVITSQDQVYVMKLKYRPENKNKKFTRIEDFDFFRVQFQEIQ